ncbi:MAG: hypothetical protein RLN60_00290 [Phycisphaerales bacterium]
MPRHRTIAITALATSLLALSACSRTVVERDLATDYDTSDAFQSVDFWHNLPGNSAVTNGEGLHGLILFADGQDPNTTYEERVDYLKALGWLPERFDEPAEMAMRRGTLAKGLVSALNIEGGVMYRLTGVARYANRELVFLNIMPAGTDYQVLNGYEYVGVISKAQDYELLQQGLKAENVPPSAEELEGGDAAEEAPPEPDDAG